MKVELEKQGNLRVIKAFDKGNVIGQAQFRHTVGMALMESIWVDEQYRRFYIGSEIAAKAEAGLKREGCRNILTIMRGSYPDLFTGEKFLESLGYMPITLDLHFIRIYIQDLDREAIMREGKKLGISSGDLRADATRAEKLIGTPLFMDTLKYIDVTKLQRLAGSKEQGVYLLLLWLYMVRSNYEKKRIAPEAALELLMPDQVTLKMAEEMGLLDRDEIVHEWSKAI